jgi:hypothetical protein
MGVVLLTVHDADHQPAATPDGRTGAVTEGSEGSIAGGDDDDFAGQQMRHPFFSTTVTVAYRNAA